jgi:hypothetical protein
MRTNTIPACKKPFSTLPPPIFCRAFGPAKNRRRESILFVLILLVIAKNISTFDKTGHLNFA